MDGGPAAGTLSRCRGGSPPGLEAAMEEKIRILDELEERVGGRFSLTALLQKRVRELVRGQKPLFETRERNYIRIAAEELERGLIELVADDEPRSFDV